MQFIDLKAQYRALKDEIDANIRGVLDSAQFIGGPYVKELEAQLEEKTERWIYLNELKEKIDAQGE